MMLHERPWSDWKRLLTGVRLPAAVIDLDALDHNLDLLLARCAPDVTLRLASKSIRCLAILQRLLARGDGRVRGAMTFSVDEAQLLTEAGIDDVLCGYPIGQRAEAEIVANWWRAHGPGRTAGSHGVVPMVDSVQHVRMWASVAREAGVTIPLCIDVDVSLRPAPGVHLGVRRSPVREPAQAVAIARAAQQEGNVTVIGAMAYEAQVAGLPDHVPGQGLLDPARSLLKARSLRLAAQRRREVAHALAEVGAQLTLVNGGGTGSVRATSHDGTCTEVTAGSGFYCPTLFDHYRDLPLRPAAFFALPVVRSSDPDHVTCGFGGFVASGPCDASRAPIVHAPPELAPLGMEGFGEVQTPLKLTGAERPGLGDPVICRHAKAGELLAHFGAVHLARGGELVQSVPTYPRFFGPL